MKIKTLYFVLCFLLLANSAAVAQTTLQNAFNAIPAGQPTLFTPNVSGMSDIFGNSDGSSISEFSESMAWDPINKLIRFCGQAHGTNYFGKCVKYTDSTNTWVEDTWPPDPPWCKSGTSGNPCFQHAYDHNTIDQATGDFYLLRYGTKSVFRFRSGAWQTLTPDLPTSSTTCCKAQKWFPALGLIVVDGDWGVWKGVMGSGTSVTWTRLADTAVDETGLVNLTGLSDTEVGAEYSPVKQVFITYWGTKLYKLDAAGTWNTSMIASPVNLGIQSAAVSADPVTGNFVVISSGSSTIRIFNPDGNGSWSVAGGTLPSALQWTKGSGDEPQEVPITNYNGIMWMKFNGSTVSYIYKASTSSDTTAPTAPSGLTVNAISASQIDLSWTASTDAVGVTGYNVERCALAGCVNFVEVYQPGAVSQSDTGLTAATLYRYRVRAHDAAGNLSGYSAIAQATTQSGGVSADQDFINRRTSPGVIRWFGFDDNSALPRASPGNNEDWGHDFGVMPSGAGALPTIGTSVKASGAGALHYVQAVGSSSGSAGSWFTHFGVNKTGQIGAGERIFVQFRVRWSPEMLVNSNWPGSGGAKIMDISLGDLPSCVPGDSSTCPTSCPNQGFEFVIQNNQARGIPTAYANCHNPAAFVEMAASTVPPGGVNPQNMVSGCTDANALGTCVPFVANEWMTFQVMLQVGTWGTFSSPVKVWFAREGQPSTLIIDCESGVTPSCTRDFAGASNGWVFVNDDPANFKMGKVYLHPYQTGMSGALASATIDYDELIISTQQIPDPGAAAVAISAPSSIRVTNRY